MLAKTLWIWWGRHPPRFLRHSQRTKVPELAEGQLPLRAGPQSPARNAPAKKAAAKMQQL